MRVGIFGGSFDPVHYGHLLLAEHCREAANLEEIWFVPTWISPHKQDQPPASPQARCEMLELAVAGKSSFLVNRIEVDRQGVSFTVETLEQLHAQHPTHDFSLLMGADSLVDLPKWREPERICELASILIVGRIGEPQPNMDTLQSLRNKRNAGSHHHRDQFVSMPLIQLSSTELRNRVRTGSSIRYQTPRAVEKYLETHSLYQDQLAETQSTE